MKNDISDILKSFPDKSKITPKLLQLMEETGQKELADEIREKLLATPTEFYLKKFITQHPTMLRLKEQVRKISNLDDSVLIIGDSGTGKELLANALHGDRKGNFVAINCAGMPENLIESELFGHIKGAFTGANIEKIGLLEEAKDGTIFLDEIGDLTLPVQAKLLRAIQEKKVRKVGSNTETDINCRIVSATHHRLDEMIEESKKETIIFREDLYWRISTFILKPLPLAARSADIPLLIDYIDVEHCIKDIDKFCNSIDVNKLTGNVRSLQRIVKRFCILGLNPHE